MQLWWVRIKCKGCGSGGGNGGRGTEEPDLTRPPGQAPCHCRGEGQTMDKNYLNMFNTLPAETLDFYTRTYSHFCHSMVNPTNPDNNMKRKSRQTQGNDDKTRKQTPAAE